MKTYKKTDGSLWAFEKNGSQDHLITKDMVMLTKSDLIEIANKSEQITINQIARDYLRKTDWYIVRFAETGEPIPEEITTKRAESRSSIIE